MNTEIIFKLILIFFLIYCIIKCYTKKDIEKYADIDQKSSEIEKASAEAAGKAAAVSSTVSISAATIAAVVAALNSASSPTVPSYNTLKDNNQCLQKVTNENCMRCLYDIGVNSNAGNQELIDAYLEWNVKPGVENGVMLYGGATSHNIGSGSDVQLWSAYTDISSFAISNGPDAQVNADIAPKFWSLVEGAHNDQIYVHVGHTINKEFNFAGKDN